MVEVRLHGPLAATFGKVWNLDIKSVAEAITAISVNRPTFKRVIRDLDEQGLVFRIRSKTRDFVEEDLGCTLGSIARIDIIPIVRGASAGVRFVVGAALLVVSYLFPVSAPYLAPIGASLMFGAVAEWLTPVQKKSDSSNKLDSWTFSGPTNTVDQGTPVPVIYGEVLTGGYTISAGITTAQLSATGAVAASVSIGGDANPVIFTGAGGDYTAVLRLSAAPLNMAEPLGYAWTVTGFSGVTAIRVTGQNTATVRIEMDCSGLAVNTQTTVTGNVSINMTGKNINGSGDGVSASASTTSTVVIDTRQAGV